MHNYDCSTLDVGRSDCDWDYEDGSDESASWAVCAQEIIYYCENNSGKCEYDYSLKQWYVISRSGSLRPLTHSVKTQLILCYP